MSEIDPSTHPTLNDSVYALTQHGGEAELVERKMIGRRGPELILKQENNSGYSVNSEHRRNVFTQEQVALTADNLLPTPQDGEEQLLSGAIQEIMNNPEHRRELLVRLGAAALSDRLTAQRDEADYGVRSLDDLVGAPDERGSNMWKVEDLITFGKTGAKASNTLVLAHAENEELSMLSEHEAAKIRERISATNRMALDKIYDYYDVSFANATVYEQTLSDGRTRRTSVYPSASESIYFMEDVVGTQGNTPDYVQIVTDKPNFSSDEGYIRVV